MDVFGNSNHYVFNAHAKTSNSKYLFSRKVILHDAPTSAFLSPNCATCPIPSLFTSFKNDCVRHSSGPGQKRQKHLLPAFNIKRKISAVFSIAISRSDG